MRKVESLLPMRLFVDLDKSIPVPLYHQVSKTIEKAIFSGELPPGARLESEVSLAARLGLSRPTIRRAIQELVDVGLLVRRRGVGTQVVHGQVTRGLELTSFYDDLLRSGHEPTSEILALKKVEAGSELSARLGIEIGSPVVNLKRVRKVDGVPVAVMENWLNVQFSDLYETELRQFGLYQLLRTRGVSLSIARQRISARKASAEEAALLDVEKGAALLTMERVAYDSDGQAIEFGQHSYRPDLYSFETTLVQK